MVGCSDPASRPSHLGRIPVLDHGGRIEVRARELGRIEQDEAGKCRGGGHPDQADVALSMYDLTNVYGDLDFWFLARSRMLLCVGLPLIFLPIIAASCDGIPSSKTDQASALINAARNTGGSIGISVFANVLVHREQFHQNRLVEHAIPSSVQYQAMLQHVTHYLVEHGSSLLQAQQQAIDWIGQQVQAQTSFLAYMDAFWVLMLISLTAVPLGLALRKVKLGGAVPVGH